MQENSKPALSNHCTQEEPILTTFTPASQGKPLQQLHVGIVYGCLRSGSFPHSEKPQMTASPRLTCI